jgi:hypothetical protein
MLLLLTAAQSVPYDEHLHHVVQGAPCTLCNTCAMPYCAGAKYRSGVASLLQTGLNTVFLVTREGNPAGWPHTIQLGEPNCRKPETLPHK